MKPFEHPLYLEDISNIVSQPFPWETLDNKTVLISGASGLIGSCLIDVLMACEADCSIVALGRNESAAKERFVKYADNDRFRFVSHDVNSELPDVGGVDFVFHLASNTHPVAYATKPAETIFTNIFGTRNMLDYARNNGALRFVFASSNEVYGINRGDAELFSEDYCGYIDCNTLRAGYPESKRCGEALCQAYMSQYGMDVVVPRLTRCFGPTLRKDDTKALSQFINNALHHEDIVLKSKGDQYFSYIYVADAVSALITILLKGERGCAYNVSSENCDVTLADLAKIVSKIAGTSVVFNIPDAIESAGFSRATKARLDSARLQSLGWQAMYNIEEGLKRTIETLSSE